VGLSRKAQASMVASRSHRSPLRRQVAPLSIAGLAPDVEAGGFAAASPSAFGAVSLAGEL
jgi:hypothetical protein